MKIAYRFYYPWWFKSFRIFQFKKPFKTIPIYKLHILGNEFIFYGKGIEVKKLANLYRKTRPSGWHFDISHFIPSKP